MGSYIIPSVIVTLLVYSKVKKVSIYKTFVMGSAKSVNLVMDIFPYIVAVFIAIELLIASGLSALLGDIMYPVLSIFSVPKELVELIIIKPFSGSGSLAILDNILSNDPDSYIARVASVIAGSSEAVFFVSAVLFSKTKVEKLRYAIPLILVLNFITVILAVWVCKYI